MPYGRTLIEVISVQVLIIAAFLLVPFDLIAELGPISAGLVTATVTLAAAQVLHMRHRRRMAAHSFGRKLHVLRTTSL